MRGIKNKPDLISMLKYNRVLKWATNWRALLIGGRVRSRIPRSPPPGSGGKLERWLSLWRYRKVTELLRFDIDRSTDRTEDKYLARNLEKSNWTIYPSAHQFNVSRRDPISNMNFSVEVGSWSSHSLSQVFNSGLPDKKVCSVEFDKCLYHSLVEIGCRRSWWYSLVVRPPGVFLA